MELASGGGLPGQTFLASGNPKYLANRSMLSSGFEALSSGHESWAAFAIGNGLGQSAPTPFQLAPRLYVVTRTIAHLGGDSAEILRPLGELPIHLTFQDSLYSNNDRLRQVWKSESGTDWNWELTVERLDGGIQATMAAIPCYEVGLGRFTWQRIGDWNPFGSNSLTSDKVKLPPLVVSAP